MVGKKMRQICVCNKQARIGLADCILHLRERAARREPDDTLPRRRVSGRASGVGLRASRPRHNRPPITRFSRVLYHRVGFPRFSSFPHGAGAAPDDGHQRSYGHTNLLFAVRVYRNCTGTMRLAVVSHTDTARDRTRGTKSRDVRRLLVRRTSFSEERQLSQAGLSFVVICVGQVQGILS
jgi:hypothetical protein